jgi:hypothetical protein
MNAFLSTELKLDLKRYRKIMGYPLWGYLCQAVDITRSYQEGLEFDLLLIRFTEDNLHKLSEREHSCNLKRLYRFALRMVDALDRWEEYLATWKTMRANTTLTDAYPKNEWNLQDPGLQSFLLREEAHLLHVHFLWLTLGRKETIERKLARKRSGKKIGNLLHQQKPELTEEEIQRRLDFLAAKMRWVEKTKALIDSAVRAGI